jgi:NitT/TauT family transport system permease protein
MIRAWLRVAVSAVVILILWELAAVWIDERLFLPRVENVLSILGERTLLVDVPRDSFVSIGRVLAGYTLAVAVGVPLGIVADVWLPIGNVIVPWLSFLRYTPTAALLPILILWFGVGEATRIILIALGVVFHVALGTLFVVKTVPRGIIELAAMLRLSRGARYRAVIVPAALPGICDVCRIGLGWAWTYVVLAELVAADAGLGFMIRNGQRFLRPEVSYAGVLVIGALGIVSDAAFRMGLRRAFPWHATFGEA